MLTSRSTRACSSAIAATSARAEDAVPVRARALLHALRYEEGTLQPRRPLNVSFTLRNTGDRTGAEVAQVYAVAADQRADAPEATRRLGQGQLDPGESRRVTVPSRASPCPTGPWAQTLTPAPAKAPPTPPTQRDRPGQRKHGRSLGDTRRPGDAPVGASVQDIRLTDTVTLAAGTCAEDSDIAGGAGRRSGPGAPRRPAPGLAAASPGRVGPRPRRSPARARSCATATASTRCCARCCSKTALGSRPRRPHGRRASAWSRAAAPLRRARSS